MQVTWLPHGHVQVACRQGSQPQKCEKRAESWPSSSEKDLPADRLGHGDGSLCSQPLVEDTRDLSTEWIKETLAAYLWLSLQRGLRVRLDK
jgi:hypothetical protein